MGLTSGSPNYLKDELVCPLPTANMTALSLVERTDNLKPYCAGRDLNLICDTAVAGFNMFKV